MSDDDLTEIKVLTARIDERLGALQGAMSVQHSALSEKIDRMAAKTEMDDIDARVKKLESAQSWVVKGLIGAGATALAAASGLTKKLGL